ncbi:hypothetical protein [Streptomyces sp. CB03238]|uniref:hypothetical protein n=1 Tax=Streptomyces sp. CB03238 TaxID=1907777 RepID=UPI000A10C8AD|nr:hypothetical protein [Streptomyces sp. CB03238]ORT58230.1 hypothetical protein BKD26_20215 [Streptomyces sp. CB03238]
MTIDLSTLAETAADTVEELTDDQREQLKKMGEEAGITKETGTVAETAFLVVITPDGQVLAEPNINTKVRTKRPASLDDFQRAGHVLVDDAIAIKTASITGQQMMQMTAALVEQQRTNALVNSLKL